MIRPSSLKYIEICSDFEQPEQTEVHPVTEAGSRLHEAMETGNLSKIEEDEMWMYDRACQARTDLMTDVFGDAEPTVHKELILKIADEGDYYEIQEEFAKNIITCFIRLEGQTVGVVANQPMVLAGCLDIDASRKAARFVRFCDCFNIPIVNFVDVTGFLGVTSKKQISILDAIM